MGGDPIYPCPQELAALAGGSLTCLWVVLARRGLCYSSLDPEGLCGQPKSVTFYQTQESNV